MPKRKPTKAEVREREEMVVRGREIRDRLERERAELERRKRAAS